jgi:hypothetical protein
MPIIQVTGQAMAQTTFENKAAKYIKIWETYVGYQNLERKRLWTCWFDSEITNQTAEDFIIEGDLGCKVGSYYDKTTNEQKQVVEYTLNNCVIKYRSSNDTPVIVTEANFNDAPF